MIRATGRIGRPGANEVQKVGPSNTDCVGGLGACPQGIMRFYMV